MWSARPKFMVGVGLVCVLAGCQPGVPPTPRDAGSTVVDARTMSPSPGGPSQPAQPSADGPTIPADAGGGGIDVAARDAGVDLGMTVPTMDAASDPAAPADTGGSAPAPAGAVVWAIDNLQSIGGHRAMVLGAPMVIDTPEGKALQFDGQDDALFVDNHPLARLSQFTVELYFRPDPGGSQAQRWFHMQDDGSSAKVLFETRLFGNSFVLDVFVESAGGEIALYAPERRHPLGAWYHVAAVVDGQRARHYVNGQEEMNAALPFRPHGEGRTSIGVRITRMYYFKGAIRLARFTPRALTPDQFLKPPSP